jgi:hypothetical protein
VVSAADPLRSLISVHHKKINSPQFDYQKLLDISALKSVPLIFVYKEAIVILLTGNVTCWKNSGIGWLTNPSTHRVSYVPAVVLPPAVTNNGDSERLALVE